MILQNWIEIESVDFPNRLYPHRWTMKIHFYFISLSWNMFYNIFIRTKGEIKNIQSRFPLSCFSGSSRGWWVERKKNWMGKNSIITSAISERHTKRTRRGCYEKLWWWYPGRISNKTTYMTSLYLHIHGDGKYSRTFNSRGPTMTTCATGRLHDSIYWISKKQIYPVKIV